MTSKGLFDLLLAIPGLLLFVSLSAAVAVWIRLDSPGPVFFRLVRVGQHGREFRILKFRTICLVPEGSGPQVPRCVAAFSDAYRKIVTAKPGMTDDVSLAYLNENELLRGVADPGKIYLVEILPAKIELYRKRLNNRSILADIALNLRTIRRIVS